MRYTTANNIPYEVLSEWLIIVKEWFFKSNINKIGKFWTFISGSTLLGVEGVEAGLTTRELAESGSTPFLSL